MTRQEFLSSLRSQIIDLKIVKKVEKKYGFEIPEIVQKIISASIESIFFDDGSTDFIKNGIKVRTPIVLGAYETKTMQYYFRTNKKGVRTYTVSVKRTENGSEVVIATKSQILNITEGTIIG